VTLSEIEFAFFLPLVLLVHWLLPRRAGVQNAWLVAASCLFYATWSVPLLGLLLGSTVVDWAVARALGRRPPRDDLDARTARERRALLATSLAVNLAALAFFKYEGFFAESLNALLARGGLPASLPVLRLVLPLGISFYTLQKLGYVLDVHDGRLPACRSLLTFTAFTTFFPQLTAGPISRGRQLLPQLEAPRRLAPDLVAAGAATFMLGFALKAFAADTLGLEVVDPVFARPGAYTAAAHWAALVGYALQVFADFCGYSLLAIGTARLLGLELPANFNFPFVSRSVMEFWRRWHITLNTWLFDYIYGPLVTSKGWWRNRLDLGFLAVFLISGLWHGPQWTFVLWGAIHGVALVVHRHWDEFYRGLCRKDRAWVQRRKRPAYAAVAWGLTQGVFVLSLVPFRAPSIGEAARFARGLVAGGPESLAPGLPALLTVGLAVALLVVHHLVGGVPALAGAWTRFQALPAPLRGAAYGVAAALLALFTPIAGGQFIYAQF
jgi:alginate O-acetyltransferase complex protein AlgI